MVLHPASPTASHPLYAAFAQIVDLSLGFGFLLTTLSFSQSVPVTFSVLVKL